MSGLTFIAYYHDPAVPLAPYVRWNRSTHFVAPDWNEARNEAYRYTQVGETLIKLEISDPQRLLDPELDHNKLRVEDVLFSVDWGEVQDVAAEKGLPADLSADEMSVFLACLRSGLSCWAEVVQLALAAAVSERSNPE